MKNFTRLFDDCLHLFYPHHCEGCGSDLVSNKQLLCVYCLNELPKTHFASLPQNSTESIFLGRLPIKAAHSEYYFSKGQLLQGLIHQLKYKNKPEIGQFLGNLLGETLLLSGRFSQLDMILPVPMYKDKEYKRGYNQAAVIGNGISEVLKVPVNTSLLLRSHATETQTRKHRAERWTNVANSFQILQQDKILGKNILLVDDVLTTGASLEACGQHILRISGTQLSIATLALTSK